MNSELSKGLIFRWEGSERHPLTDMVSLAAGTATATYNVLDRQGSGRREVVYNGSTSYTQTSNSFALGTGDFSICVSVKRSRAFLSYDPIIATVTGSYTGFFISELGYVMQFGDGSGQEGILLPLLSAASVIGSVDKIAITITRSGYCDSYMNGVLKDHILITTPTSLSIPTSAIYIGRSWAGYFSGSISMCRIFNYALTPTQITNYSKPEYPIEASDRDGAGNLCVLDLNAEGLSQSTSGYWYDKTNTLTATNSGTSLVVPPASNLSATYFNGSTSNIAFTGMNGLTGDITISCWVNSFGISGLKPIFINNKIQIYTSGNKLLLISDGSTSYTSTVVSLATYIPTLIVFVRKSSGIVDIYSSVSGTMALVGSGSSGTPAANNGSWLIGTDTGYYFNGLINNFNIWSRLLSSDEITLVKDTNF